MGHAIQRRTLMVALLGIAAAGTLGYCAQKPSGKKASGSRAAQSHPATKPTVPAAPAVPLRSGEILDFTAHLAKISNVASIRLQVAERRDFFGHAAWHLQAFARTQNTLRLVFELDDQFDSYSDVATLASLQYELHLNERGKRVDAVQRMATGNAPAPPNAIAVRVLPGTRDPLGMLQFLRTVDWKKTPEVRAPVFDGHKLYDVRARLAGDAEKVKVPAGQYTASRIDVRIWDNGAEVKDTHFALLLANNGAHTPVLLEAAIPFANARVELTRAR